MRDSNEKENGMRMRMKSGGNVEKGKRNRVCNSREQRNKMAGEKLDYRSYPRLSELKTSLRADFDPPGEGIEGERAGSYAEI